MCRWIKVNAATKPIWSLILVWADTFHSGFQIFKFSRLFCPEYKMRHSYVQMTSLRISDMRMTNANQVELYKNKYKYESYCLTFEENLPVVIFLGQALTKSRESFCISFDLQFSFCSHNILSKSDLIMFSPVLKELDQIPVWLWRSQSNSKPKRWTRECWGIFWQLQSPLMSDPFPHLKWGKITKNLHVRKKSKNVARMCKY